MAKRIIEISVNDEYVLGSGVVIGAAGADESVILRVAFNDAWTGLNIYATFRNSMGESPTVVMLTPSMLSLGETMVYEIAVPAAATAHAGKMSLVFSGYSVSTVTLFDPEVTEKLVYRDAVINSGNAYFRVLPSDFSALDVEDRAEATVLEQVLAEINELHGDIVEHKEIVADQVDELAERVEAAEGVVAQLRAEADSGAFKGEKGDKGDQGERGIQGEKGDKGDQGEQGIQGIQGIQGEQGIPGERGEKGDAGVIEFIVVAKLPTENIKNAIYLVHSADQESDNAFDEYIYVDGVWEKIGNASVDIDFDAFAKKEYVDAKAAGIQEANEAYVDEVVGDIGSALDSLHAYAEALKGGDAV